MSDITLKINKGKFLLIVLCALIAVSAFGTIGSSPIRYLKYLIPIIFLFFVRFNSKFRKSPILTKNLNLYLVLIGFNFFISLLKFNITFRFFEEAALILIPIITVIILVSYINRPIQEIINAVFYSYAVVFVITNFHVLFSVNFFAQFADALKTSELATESWLAFPLGLFVIYFAQNRDWRKLALASVLFLLAFKRISIAGVLAALFLYWVINRNGVKTKKLFNVYVWFLVLNIALLLVLYNFISGNFNEIITTYTGISPNWFTQGRLSVYSETLAHFSDNFLFGSSLGSTNIFLNNTFENISFLHSDILKIIIELGFLSYIVWVLYFFKINLVNHKAIPILIYVNILFLSDNVFIYFDTLLVFYLLVTYQSYTQINNEVR